MWDSEDAVRNNWALITSEPLQVQRALSLDDL